ncbi:hypothetical protein ACFP1Z_26950 [Streptomyces gamaensis]|uniref:Transposase n=1 Tax=Streptomyces gamaensis TaxID=1763542 RepID=A0ABW0Z4T3_9ACTN
MTEPIRYSTTPVGLPLRLGLEPPPVEDRTCCANGNKIKQARIKALAEGRHETAGRLAEALARHQRSTHGQPVTRKESLSARVAAANAQSWKAANRW